MKRINSIVAAVNLMVSRVWTWVFLHSYYKNHVLVLGRKLHWVTGKQRVNVKQTNLTFPSNTRKNLRSQTCDAQHTISLLSQCVGVCMRGWQGAYTHTPTHLHTNTHLCITMWAQTWASTSDWRCHSTHTLSASLTNTHKHTHSHTATLNQCE